MSRGDNSLYVIPGSHACRAAMLMLEHKAVPYRRVDVIAGTHPVVARLHGFDTGGQTRHADGRRPRGLRLADRLATVPALAYGDLRISTNHGIARFLEERHPEPPLFPADADERRAVEDAERWANETLQMAARRLLASWAVRDSQGFSRAAADGRMGYLLFRSERVRRLLVPRLLGGTFVAGRSAEPALLAELPALLDRVDALIADGVIGGDQLNAADFMIAPSLALILYRSDVESLFEGRPARALVDRILPEPGRRGGDDAAAVTGRRPSS